VAAVVEGGVWEGVGLDVGLGLVDVHDVVVDVQLQGGGVDQQRVQVRVGAQRIDELLGVCPEGNRSGLPIHFLDAGTLEEERHLAAVRQSGVDLDVAGVGFALQPQERVVGHVVRPIHLVDLAPALVDDVAPALHEDCDYFVAAVGAAQHEGVLLCEEVLSGVDEDAELEGSLAVVGDVEVDYFGGEGIGEGSLAGLVEGEGVPYLDAFGSVGDVNLIGQYVGGEGEQEIGLLLAEHEVVLHSFCQLLVLGGDVRVDVDGELQLVQTVAVALDRKVDHLDALIHQHLDPSIPRKQDVLALIQRQVLLVGGLSHRQGGEGVDVPVDL
jgi:hypothetical protein